MINSRAVAIASTAGTVLQVAMVVTGDYNDSVKAMFAVGGMGISFIAGIICALMTPAGERSLTVSSIVTGAIGGAIGKFFETTQPAD